MMILDEYAGSAVWYLSSYGVFVLHVLVYKTIVGVFGTMRSYNGPMDSFTNG
jgi:hypothetical protein